MCATGLFASLMWISEYRPVRASDAAAAQAQQQPAAGPPTLVRLIAGKNDKHSSDVKGPCMAFVTIPKLTSPADSRVVWIVDNGYDNECENLDVSKIRIEFKKNILVDPADDKKRTNVAYGYAPGWSVTGRLAPELKVGSKFKYKIYFDRDQASDPELDIGDVRGDR